MQKDVIYIDVDDDITAIIGKLKASKHEIVALVPPKRVGVLQSAVNLRLMKRAADQRKKRLVLVTNNQALLGLAAAASIPVAKTLQSKPEIPEIAALDVDDGEDVIDGSELPVGEHVTQAEASDASEALGAAAVAKTTTPASLDTQRKAAIAAAKAKKGPKVPNFDIFRKKLIFIILGVLLLVGFLIWAIVFAPRARIELSTRATESAVSQPVTLGTNLQTSGDNNTLQSVQKTLEKPISLEFTATGKKDVGEKAHGSVRFSTDSISVILSGRGTIPAGTTLTSSSGAKYTTDSTVTLSASSPSGSTGITAAESGEKYNGATGTMTGAPSGVDARVSTATTGGTDKTITVVTASDIETAKQKAADSIDQSAAKQELSGQFDATKQAVLAESFNADVSSLASSIPADSEAASGKATMSGKAVYTMQGLDKKVLDEYLKGVLNRQIDNPGEQRVYDTGVGSVAFSNVKKVDQGISATLTTNGKIGPKIEEDQVRDMAKGKRIGEIKTELEAIQGVESADIKLSPFWVSTVPNDDKKVSVEFKLNE